MSDLSLLSPNNCGNLNQSKADDKVKIINNPADSKMNDYSVELNLCGPIHQWCSNYGYCGELSFALSAFYYGIYISQWDVRRIANDTNKNKNKNIQNLKKSQLLIGVNDQLTAKKLKLVYECWPPLTPSKAASIYKDTNVSNRAKAFILWLKKKVVSGSVVSLGVYQNNYYFNDSLNDPEYDHIVTIYKWTSKEPLHQNENFQFIQDDLIFIRDHGLYKENGVSKDCICISVKDILKSRMEANLKTSPVYSINSIPNYQLMNYAIAINGILDPSNKCLPVRVIDPGYGMSEGPELPSGSIIRPSPLKIVLTIEISGLQIGQKYVLYRYHQIDKIPLFDFHAHSEDSGEIILFEANESILIKKISWSSDKLAIFRCLAMT